MSDPNTGQGTERLAKVNPRSIQDSLCPFLQPTEASDLRTEFYPAYQYDEYFVKRYNKYLDTSLIFAGLFSTLCLVFVVEVEKRLQPDPMAYLEASLQILQNPNATGRDLSPLASTGLSSSDVTISILLYASLSTSLLAAFLAMLGKQWINRDIRHRADSVAERCEDRQRKLNGLERWRFRIVVESPPVLLQLSFLLLVVGLSFFFWSFKRPVAWVVIGFAIFGVVFYTGIIIMGTLSYEGPFQTPLSLFLWYLGVNRSAKRLEPDPSADRVFWTPNHITDPEVFAFVSWSEESQTSIVLRAITHEIPTSGLSSSSQADIIAVLGTARWSLVEKLRLDRERLAKFIGGLSGDMIVQGMMDNPFVCVGWMRLLLFSTFHPPLEADTRPLWNILLTARTGIPHFFSRDLPGCLDPSEASAADFNRDYDSEIHRRKEEALWMKLFWSSRFFEIDCRSWSDFKDATIRLRKRKPAFFRQLEKLCFALEEEAQASPNPATARTKAYTEISKLLGGVHSTRASQGPDSPQALRIASLQRQDQNATTNDLRPLSSSVVAPRDTPPVGPTTHRQNTILFQLHDNVSPSPTTSAGPSSSLFRPPPPSSRERLEYVIPMNVDGGQRPPPV
ncbi:hypothetical protein BDM02DRAFT_3191330 [Thelephora ganbajun]|uniref:Uncharacterized protein n=1 Tax=Thelephora ganbajun TaxID=370292 RepID=A0ACB6Z1W6_THEGA|nr:hypothetical protein BDM02DRAFT_3191330 [Thelephora ganbajun]